MKAERTQRGQLSPMAPKWKGAKNRPSSRETAPQCGYIIDGKKIPIRRKRKDGTHYTLMIVVGGRRCVRTADVKSKEGHRCFAHLCPPAC
jgi:hypothetical protein